MQLQFQQEQLDTGRGYLAVQMMLAAVFAVSIVAGLLAAIEMDVPYGSLCLSALMVSAFMHVIFRLETPLRRVAAISVFLLPGIVAVVFWKTVQAGVAVLSNRIMALIGAAKGEILLPFAIEPTIDQNFAVMLVSGLWVIWLVCATVQLQKSFHPWVMLGIGIVLIFLNAWLPQTESGLWLLVSGLCMGLYFAQHRLGDKRLMLALVIFLLTLACLLWIGGTLSKTALEEWKGNLTVALHEQIDEKVAVLRYGSNEDRAMPMGDFRNLENLEFSDASMLEIRGENYTSMYLRGFVGGTFTGDQWQPLEGEDLYQNASTFYWLHKDGYFGQNLLAASAQTLNPDVVKDKQSYQIEVTGADSRVYYTPYELTNLQAGETPLLKDSLLWEDGFWASGWKGAETYEIETLDNQVKQYPVLIGDLIDCLKEKKVQPFRKAESHYNRFVYASYCTLKDDERKLLEHYLGKEKIAAGSHMHYEEAKERILTCLDENVAYSRKLLERSAGATFLQDFLEVNQSGYSVHYATAATLMFRYYGIPARYVEGYLVTPKAVEAAKGDASLVITDQNAHAWVEYYQDGIGWIPFEVTPPYRDVMEAPEGWKASSSNQSVTDSVNDTLGMEMIEDNYEADIIEQEEEQSHIPWGTVLKVAGFLPLLILIFFLGRHLWMRRKLLLVRQQSFMQEDLSKAAAAAFYHCLALQQALGIEKRNCSIYVYKAEVEQLLGSEMASDYQETACIYQKAVYGPNQLTTEEKDQVMEYMNGLIREMKQRGSLWKRFLWKWQKGLYK